MNIKIKLNHKFGDFEIHVDFEKDLYGCTAIFGPSGCGKTTFLRFLAGLLPTSNSYLSIYDQVLCSKNSFIPSHKRNIGFVFQTPLLFPHLDVNKNLDYAIKRRAESHQILEPQRIVELLKISQLMDKSVSQLSGGQKQKVALARALMSSPDVLLLDEPMASLDEKSKEEIFPLLNQIKSELEIPLIYVSHSKEEITQIADKVMVMKDGSFLDNAAVYELNEWAAKDKIQAEVIESDEKLTTIKIPTKSLSKLSKFLNI
jgi:molybdate transport system ATP-binding protein